LQSYNLIILIVICVMNRTPNSRMMRKGAVAVELAICAPFVFLMVVGLLELSRMAQVQQILSNAAREGARLSAQGLIINSTGSSTQISVNSGTPSVTSIVKDTIARAGLPTTNVTVQFAALTGSPITHPYEAIKGQVFKVTVTIPYADVNNINFNMFSPNSLTSSATMVSLVDDPFTINATLPTN
jgi:Flp pilus assembly protein TadG